MSEKQQLYKTTIEQLLKEIKTGKYSNLQKLPPEIEIAQDFGVSRTLIRDCLMSIEQEGIVTRKLGVGTVINKHVLDVVTRMDLELEFMEMVEQAGYKPGISYVKINETIINEEVAQKLKLNKNDLLVSVEKVITADGKPAIFCIDYFPKKIITHKSPDYELLKKPIFDFLNKFCGVEVYMDLTEVKAINTDQYLSSILNIDVGIPIIFMDEIGYSFKGKPILHSKEYYADGIFKQTVLRKKI
ncbi:MAG: GntR family transcriptional regulator [Firmicutes bacterium]|nr:GntR family transcriptional regulator [Bacillota bacterium]